MVWRKRKDPRSPKWEQILAYMYAKLSQLVYIGDVVSGYYYEVGRVLVLQPMWDSKFKKMISYTLRPANLSLEIERMEFIEILESHCEEKHVQICSKKVLDGELGGGFETLRMSIRGSRDIVEDITFHASQRQRHFIIGKGTHRQSFAAALMYGDCGINIRGLVEENSVGHSYGLERDKNGNECDSKKKCFFLITETEFAEVNMYYNRHKRHSSGVEIEAAVVAAKAVGRYSELYGFQHLGPERGFIGLGLYAFMTFGPRDACSVTDLYYVGNQVMLRDFFRCYKQDYLKYAVVTFKTQNESCSVVFDPSKLAKNGTKLDQVFERIRGRGSPTDSAVENIPDIRSIIKRDSSGRKYLLAASCSFLLLTVIFIMISSSNIESEVSDTSCSVEADVSVKELAPFLFPLEFIELSSFLPLLVFLLRLFKVNNGSSEGDQVTYDKQRRGEHLGSVSNDNGALLVCASLILVLFAVAWALWHYNYMAGEMFGVDEVQIMQDDESNGCNRRTMDTGDDKNTNGGQPGLGESFSDDFKDKNNNPLTQPRPKKVNGATAPPVTPRHCVEGKALTEMEKVAFRHIENAVNKSENGIAVFPHGIGAICAKECEAFVRKRNGKFKVVENVDLVIFKKTISRLLDQTTTIAYTVSNLGSPGARSTATEPVG